MSFFRTELPNILATQLLGVNGQKNCYFQTLLKRFASSQLVQFDQLENNNFSEPVNPQNLGGLHGYVARTTGV